MLEKIKSTLWALPPFGLALWLGYSITLQMTGSVDKAVERMVVAIVLWAICALAWAVVCAVPRILMWMMPALHISPHTHGGKTALTTRATRLEGASRHRV